jgi:16S rRNA (cytosine1402-N4)-methyltransferase
VLLTEVLRALEPVADGTIIDATFGAGGYSQAILAAGAMRVLGIDRDASAVLAGAAIAAQAHGRLVLEHGRFSDLEALARRHGLEKVDGVVFDLGVSSMQLDESDRGFSFQAEGPLDMRMSATGMSAADVVNTRSEQEIAAILFQLGEERRSRAIARAIVQARQISPVKTTKELPKLSYASLEGRAAASVIPPHDRFRRCASSSMMNWASLSAASSRPSGS